MQRPSVSFLDLLTNIEELEIPIVDESHCRYDKMIGAGASMVVYEGSCCLPGSDMYEPVAFKVPKQKIGENATDRRVSQMLQDIRQDVKIMGHLAQLGTPNIVALHGITFKDHLKPVMIVERADDTLTDYLETEKTSWTIKAFICKQLADGIQGLHDAGIVHGDLKGQNILIFKPRQEGCIPLAKISDFGYSASFASIAAGSDVGCTPNFQAPECNHSIEELGQWRKDHYKDIYSYGLMVWQIANNGSEPFEEYDDSHEIISLKCDPNAMQSLMEQLPDDTPSVFRTVIEGTTQYWPMSRMSLEKAGSLMNEFIGAESPEQHTHNKTLRKNSNPSRQNLRKKERRRSSKPHPLTVSKIPGPVWSKVFHDYEKSANEGDAESFYHLGVCYHFGIGIDENKELAAYNYTKAADAGHTRVLFQLGELFARTNIKSAEATGYYLRAAEVGDIDAAVKIANLYDREKDDVKALEWYLRVANYSRECSYEAGRRLVHSIGTICKPEQGFRLLYEAAKPDSSPFPHPVPPAMYEVANCYEVGNGVEIDQDKALHFYCQAAANNCDKAAQRLKQILSEISDPKNTSETTWLLSNQAIADAQYSLGLFYFPRLFYDDSIMDQLSRIFNEFFLCSEINSPAFEWFQKAADRGSTEALLGIGACYSGGVGVEQSWESAFSWFIEAADAGVPAAASFVGYCYEKGLGTCMNFTKALEWYMKIRHEDHQLIPTWLCNSYDDLEDTIEDFLERKQSADNGDEEDQLEVGFSYLEGEGTEIDHFKAFEYFSKAANSPAGNPNALTLLGACYERGFGIDKPNHTVAFEHYTKAADSGSSIAMAALSRCYEKGIGVAINFQLAREWRRRATEEKVDYQDLMKILDPLPKTTSFIVAKHRADKGNREAQYQVYLAFKNGIGTKQDIVQAFEYLSRSAKANLGAALNSMGFCYKTGYFVEQNPIRAFEYFWKAAHSPANHPVGMANLGRCYEDGYAVPTDLYEAHKWYEKAYSAGERQYTAGACERLKKKINEKEDFGIEELNYTFKPSRRTSPYSFFLSGILSVYILVGTIMLSLIWSRRNAFFLF